MKIAKSSKNEIPKVLWHAIFQYLPWREVINTFTQVNRLFNEYAESLPILFPQVMEPFKVQIIKNYLPDSLYLIQTQRLFTLQVESKDTLAQLRIQARSSANMSQLPMPLYDAKQIQQLEQAEARSRFNRKTLYNSLEIKTANRDRVTTQCKQLLMLFALVYFALKYLLGLPDSWAFFGMALGAPLLNLIMDTIEVNSELQQKRKVEVDHDSKLAALEEVRFIASVWDNYYSFAGLTRPQQNIYNNETNQCKKTLAEPTTKILNT